MLALTQAAVLCAGMRGVPVMAARGIKNVKIEYSTDGQAWIGLAAPENIVYGETADTDYPFQLAKASGENGIPATNLNTADHQPVEFHGITARYVRLTPKDSWGSENYWGLSEVVFTKQGGEEAVSAEDVEVKTTKGQLPELPAFADVTCASGSQGKKAVVWDSYDTSLCDQEGQFTVTGKIFGTEVEIRCTVTVKRPDIVNKKALLNHKKVTSVVIGKYVTAIGSSAFSGCAKLTKVTIGVSVKKIGKKAFYGCKKLKSITIRTKSLTKKSVGSKAFGGTSTKAVIRVPKGKAKAYTVCLRAKGVGRNVKIK